MPYSGDKLGTMVGDDIFRYPKVTEELLEEGFGSRWPSQKNLFTILYEAASNVEDTGVEVRGV